MALCSYYLSQQGKLESKNKFIQLFYIVLLNFLKNFVLYIGHSRVTFSKYKNLTLIQLFLNTFYLIHILAVLIEFFFFAETGLFLLQFCQSSETHQALPKPVLNFFTMGKELNINTVGNTIIAHNRIIAHLCFLGVFALKNKKVTFL